MTHQTTAHTFLRRFWLKLLLVQSLSWIGVLTLLTNNLVLAQTESSIDVIIPTTTTSKPPAAAPIVKSAPNAPQTAPDPARVERLRSRISTSPAPVRVEGLRQKLSPRPVRVRDRSRREIATPPASRSVPKIRSVAQPPIKPRRLEKTATNTTPDYNSAYIDPTAYSIGATRGYQAPNAVVLSERSTGCKAVLRRGQGLSGSLCNTAQRQRIRVTVKGDRAINSINSARLPRPQASSWTRRSRTIAMSEISPVRVRPIGVGKSGGSRVTRRTPSFQGQVASVNPMNRAVNRILRFSRQTGNTNTGLLFPLTVPAQITSLFGWRIHPITGDRRFHSGTDLGASLGTPVVAAYAGNVASTDFLGGYGLTVVLEHNQSTQQTLYPHLSEILVQPGEWVEQGTVIGRVGSTGNSTGPHLHFETRQLTPQGWVATNPTAQLESALVQMVEALRSTH